MIKIEHLTKSYGERVLFEDLNIHFPLNERIALIGENGAGKSTLLNIITGQEEQDHGQVIISSNLKIGFLPQEPNPKPEKDILSECVAGAKEIFALKKKLEKSLLLLEQDSSEEHIKEYHDAEELFKTKGGYAIESKAAAILYGLGFQQEIFSKEVSILSGGWKMRLELAKIFLSEPDFLILDEPTNHLDLPSLVWVEDYLQAFKGTLLFVSHDISLLNRLATTIFHLSGQGIDLYQGNYDKFLAARALREEQEASELDQLKKKRQHLQSFVDRFGAKATKARQAKSKEKQIEKIVSQEQGRNRLSNEKNLKFSLPQPEKSPKVLLEVRHAAIGYEKPLATNINFQVLKNQKIAIIGANGIGKSTLLKTIAHKINSLDGDINQSPQTICSYFGQDQIDTLDFSRTIIENIRDSSELGDKEIRNILGSLLFSGDDIDKKIEVLSGGEKSRVGLARVLAQKSNLLLLDEPTNHLDIKSCLQLAEAMREYKGTIIFVSHDRDLINKVASHIFVIAQGGKNQIFEGKLDDYVRLAEYSNFPNVLSLADTTKDKAKVPKKELSTNKPKSNHEHRQNQKKLGRIKKNILDIENQISQIDLKIKSCHYEMSELATEDYEKLAKLNETLADYETNKVCLENQLLELLESHEILELS